MPSDVLISQRISAALLGTAVGDALGDPTEFLATRDELAAFDGPQGIRRLVGSPPQFTDDTQMTLFTTEALIIAAYEDHVDIDDPAQHELLLRRSLEAQLRWRATQVRDERESYGPTVLGMTHESDSLWHEENLQRIKAPGTTCLSALSAQSDRYTEHGPITFASNDSKGCGGVMRSAPYGLLLQDPWRIACEAARLTHGHTLGWMSAGAYAQIVRRLVAREDGADVRAVVRAAIAESISFARAEAPDAARELEEILLAACDASESRADAQDLIDCIPPRLGQGWVGEEALAIGLWCALACERVEDALAASASHRGDTDSTAAITGCLLGLIHGDDEVFSSYGPERIEAIELVERVGAVLNTLRFRRFRNGSDLPFARSWWIEDARVLGGSFAAGPTEEESRERLEALRFAGVRLIVNLQEPGEIGSGGKAFPDYEPILEELRTEHAHMRVHRMPIPDMGTPADSAAVARTLDLIDETIANGDIVYVHCWGGHGRTGTIAGCLLRRRGLDADAAFMRIAAARSHDAHLASYPSPQTEAQRAFVASWTEPSAEAERARWPEPNPEDAPAWVHDDPVFEIVPRIDDAMYRRALRVMRMLQRLHSAGYQRLRAFMFLSPSGMHWRCWIAPRDSFLPNGWQLNPDVDSEDPTQVAAYTSGMDNEYFGWRDAASNTADDLAIKFIDRFPEIARAGRGLDLAYAGWFALAVGSVEQGDLPIFLADWPGPFATKLPAPPALTTER